MASRASFPYRAPTISSRDQENRDARTSEVPRQNVTTIHNDDKDDVSEHHDDSDTPAEYHRFRHDNSILVLVVSDKLIYAGTQAGEILVFALGTYERINVVQAHNGSVLSLNLSKDGRILFSGAADRFVNMWDASSLNHLGSLYSAYDVGDIFCVAYSVSLDTVYIGCQNTSIQWCTLGDQQSKTPSNLDSHPSYRQDRFFDSAGPGGVRTPRRAPSKNRAQYATTGQSTEICKDNVHQFAHYGYVYCMLLVRGAQAGLTDDEILISGGGEGAVKVWSLQEDENGRIVQLSKLEDINEAGDPVLALAVDGTFLYSGRAEGEVNIWDLEARQLLRTLKPHGHDILALSVGYGHLFAAAVNGTVTEFDARHELVRMWKAHKGMILASAFAGTNNRPTYITGSNDSTVALWDTLGRAKETSDSSTTHEYLVDSLRQFVAFPTVSSDERCKADCHRAASWLRALLRNFGAVTELINTDHGYNPIVFANFRGKGGEGTKRKRILFYGHYDVVRAESKDESFWHKDPFTMEGVNGYLYGRGTSDNKGPIIAAIYAVAELVSRRLLDMDIVFLIEGEEECGSRGFKDAVQRNKQMIGDIDYILLANSYWLDDEVPCLTYGLRGVIHATVEVRSDEPDLHSGVDGSSLLDEPLKDLVSLLAHLTEGRGRINIPGFYDEVLPVTSHEKFLYEDIARTFLSRDPSLGSMETFATSLIKRWADPTLTLHGFKTSGPQNATIIPRSAQASLSMRLVPNQEVTDIASSLSDYLHTQFAELRSKNHLNVTIGNQAEPWLGDYNNSLFQTLEHAVMTVWNSSEGRRRQSQSQSHNRLSHLPTNSQDRATVSTSKPATSSTLANSSTSPTTEHPLSSLETALREATNANQTAMRKPLYIREGGSIPAIRFLEKEFDAPAAHLPCGQASDNAHLDNERFRVMNLYNSKEVFQLVFSQLPKKA